MRHKGKIIGHRGAAGAALENTHESFEKALKTGVDIIELDVRLTGDGQVVVIHDPDTNRIAPNIISVAKNTLAELRRVTLHNRQKIPTLDEVLTVIDDMPVMIDIKAKGMAQAIAKVMARHPKVKASFASFHHIELQNLRKINPAAPIYALEHTKPLEIIQRARKLHANGIGLNVWLMNPLTYRLARRYKLDMYIYTVNHPLLGAFIKLLYPHVHICSDHPARFVKKIRET